MLALLTHPKAFPTLIMVLNGAAALRYAIGADWGRALYWASAVTINLAVTWCVKR